MKSLNHLKQSMTPWLQGCLLVACASLSLSACEKDLVSTSKQLAQKARDCGIVSESGEYRAPGFNETLTEFDTCVFECALKSCGAIRELVCDLDETPLTDACLSQCRAQVKFACPNGPEIDGDKVCDQTSDCAETGGADESDAVCGWFHCDDGERIYADQACDGSADCADESDEPETCKTFDCGGGVKVASHFVCDGIPDCDCEEAPDEGCVDNKDETQNCATLTCN